MQWVMRQFHKPINNTRSSTGLRIHLCSIGDHPSYLQSLVPSGPRERKKTVQEWYINEIYLPYWWQDRRTTLLFFISSSTSAIQVDEKKCDVPRIHIFNSRSAFALQQTATTYTYHSCISHLPLPLPRLPSHHRRDTQSNVDWLVPR